jgi:ankyrin repeat protein
MALQHGDLSEAGEMLARHGAYLVQEGEPAFEQCYNRGRHDLVQLMVRQRSPERTTAALYAALKTGQTPLALELITRPELDPSLLAQDESALHLAVVMGRGEEVRALLDRSDVSPTCVDGTGESALHVAASCRDMTILHALLTIQPDVDVNAVDVNGWTPLHHAVRWNHVAAIDVLLQYPDTNPNVRDRSGRMPLHVAALYGQRDAIYLLMKQPGAQPTAIAEDGLGILHYLAMASEDDDEEEAGEEEEEEEDSDADAYDDESTQDDATHNEKIDLAEEMISTLVDAGIDINRESSTGTAFSVALNRPDFHIAAALLKAGCDPTIGFNGQAKWTALHHCLRCPGDRRAQTETVKRLMTYGLDPNVRNGDGTDLNALSLGKGVEICHGGTPLFFAGAYARNVDSMEVLLCAGADSNAEVVHFNKGIPGQDVLRGESLSVALRSRLMFLGRGLDGAFDLLVRHGARLDDALGNKKTALEAACEGGFGHVQELLANATGDNVSLAHVQDVIGRYASHSAANPLGLEDSREILRVLTEFRDRVWSRETAVAS